MTTALDRSQSHPGYWPSSWPVECGGNRRQKSSAGRLDAATGTARVTIRRDDKWHVMAIERDPGQWYVGSTMPAFTGPPPHGWVERIDPDTIWDSINGGLAGVSTADGALDVAWQLDVRATMQPVVFPESGELVINDFTADGSDDLVVVDVSTGELVDRVTTGSRIANGMFLTAGGNRDIFYCSTLTLAHLQWT